MAIFKKQWARIRSEENNKNLCERRIKGRKDGTIMALDVFKTELT